MDNTEFKKIVQEITSKYGFMYCKKNYYYNSDKIIVVINLQKSNFDNSYYINYGFYVKDIHNDLQYPKNNECDITGRFLNETNKGIYQLDTMNAEELVVSLEKNILNSNNREFHNVNCRFCGAIHSVNWACISVLSQVHP